MNIFVLSTSPREGSQSLRFSKYLETTCKKTPLVSSVDLMDFENFDIPTIGRGKVDKNALTDFQNDLVSNWEKADLILFVNPEYNWTTNGEVFIMMDQLGSKAFENLFENKVFAFCGVSSGRGGRLAALDVSKVVSKLISFQNKFSIVSPKIFEAHEVGKNVEENFQSTGNLNFEAGVEEFVQYSVQIAARWFQLKPL